ncbi:hypothetical protein E2C01_097860 [Portunus trituberculatus]|uniref:Uncharacterized protein n=1 Tax=Portunus trituberculatus TaxID=210409 RepID=A0A5B7KCG9_PORTR|nr:hypothetical protein [Portunus trituberculatus]
MVWSVPRPLPSSQIWVEFHGGRGSLKETGRSRSESEREGPTWRGQNGGIGEAQEEEEGSKGLRKEEEI